MFWVAALMAVSVVGIIALGLYFVARPLDQRQHASRWLKGTVATNLLMFVLGQLALMLLTARAAFAQPAAAATAQASLGFGLALIGISIPTAAATIGAGIAVSSVGAAALGVIAEKPESFGRTLVYLGLAEGIAVYGLVVTILMLNRL